MRTQRGPNEEDLGRIRGETNKHHRICRLPSQVTEETITFWRDLARVDCIFVLSIRHMIQDINFTNLFEGSKNQAIWQAIAEKRMQDTSPL